MICLSLLNLTKSKQIPYQYPAGKIIFSRKIIHIRIPGLYTRDFQNSHFVLSFKICD
jgi:hypothetical protein